MSDNRITHSNQGIRVFVDVNNSINEVSTLKGAIASTISGIGYEHLEISGNVIFLNDVQIKGEIAATNLELLPTYTKRVLFNNEGKISSSPDFSWDFDINKLSVVGEISASSFVRGDGTHLINLKSSELDYDYITLGNTQISLGDSAVTSLSNFTSISSTSFIGDLQGNSDTATKLETIRTITATGDINWYVSFDGSENVSAVSSLKTISGLISATYNNSGTSMTPFTIDTKGRVTGIGNAVTITPSYNNITDIPSNISAIASLTVGSGYLKKTNTGNWVFDTDTLISETSLLSNTYYVKVGNQKFYLGKSGNEGTSATSITGLSSVTATNFYGKLNGEATELYVNVAGTGNKNILLCDGYTAQEIETTSTTNLSFDTATNTLYADYFSGSGYYLKQIRTDNITNFSNDVRSQFYPGTDIDITNGTISYTGTSGATSSGVAGVIQYSDGSGDLDGSSNLFWDSVNNRLGIKDSAPSWELDVDGVINATEYYRIGDQAVINKVGTEIQLGSANNSIHHSISFCAAGSTGKMYIDTNGRVGINNTSPSALLHIKQTSDNNTGGIRLEESSFLTNYWDIFLEDMTPDNSLSFYYNGSRKAYISKTGEISASKFIGDGSSLTNIDYNDLLNKPSIQANDSTITIAAGSGIGNGNDGSFTTNQSSNKTITLSVDSTVVRTTGIQNIYGLKEFNDKIVFWNGFEATDGYCSDDFEVNGKFFVDVSTSRVGINNLSPAYTLDVSGVTRVDSYGIFGKSSVSSTAIRAASDNYYDLGNSSYRWDDVWATNGWIQTSDERKKDLIENIPIGLEFINKLRPVQYKWKNFETTEEDGTTLNREYKRKHFGIIAQELEQVLEEQKISTNDFGAFIHDVDSDSYAVRYGEFIPILIKSVQELSKENKELKARLDILESIVHSLM